MWLRVRLGIILAVGGSSALWLDCDLEADPGDPLSTIRHHDLGKLLLFKAKQPF